MLVTSGLVLLVLGVTQGRQWEWLSARTIGVFAASAVLLAVFALWEQRQREPLVPFSIFRLQTLTAANVAMFIMGTALFSMFLMLTLYMQQVLGYSPIKTGLAYLAVAGTAVIWANVAAVAVNKVGVKPALILGMSLLTVGLVYFTQVSVDGSYWADLFPGFLILGSRDSVRVRPDHDRRARRDEAAGGRPRFGSRSTPRSRSAAPSASRSSRRSRCRRPTTRWPMGLRFRPRSRTGS